MYFLFRIPRRVVLSPLPLGNPPSLRGDSGTRRRRKRPSSLWCPAWPPTAKSQRPSRRFRLTVFSLSSQSVRSFVTFSLSFRGTSKASDPVCPARLGGAFFLPTCASVVTAPPTLRKGIKHMIENPEKGMENITIWGETER